ncbi:MAG TPA: transcription elongation factor GreA [Patescibacteria group bacterium]|nr:transcription elongation factor GreA [Patescibacteria group bacterium]
MSDQIITPEGYNKLQEELKFLSVQKRKEIADRIERAKELGDLSENAEYIEAKDAQALNEGRILELSNTLKNVTVVESLVQGRGKIDLGSKIRARANSKEKNFELVSFNEADPLNGKISNESPLGLAFLGKKKGEEALVQTPRGVVKYKIIDVK